MITLLGHIELENGRVTQYSDSAIDQYLKPTKPKSRGPYRAIHANCFRSQQ